MARGERIDLRAFQLELSERLKHKTSAQVDNLRLAVECADALWLVRLADTGEVLPLPEPVPVPLTKSWFLGIANVRGALYGVIDFGGLLTGRATARGGAGAGAGARLVLLGSRFADIRAGLLVDKVLGLRNLTDFEAVGESSEPSGDRRWSARTWRDAGGAAWRELDMAALATDPEFLQVGA